MISIQIPFYFCSIIVCPSLYARQPASLSDEGALEEIVWCHSALSLACLTLACRMSSLLFLLLAWRSLACKMLDAWLQDDILALSARTLATFSRFVMLSDCNQFWPPKSMTRLKDMSVASAKCRQHLFKDITKIVSCRFDTHLNMCSHSLQRWRVHNYICIKAKFRNSPLASLDSFSSSLWWCIVHVGQA